MSTAARRLKWTAARPGNGQGRRAPCCGWNPVATACPARFAWDSLPESLDIPKATGLVTLVTAGRRVTFPLARQRGRAVFLGKKAPEAARKSEADSVDMLGSFGKLTDDVPLAAHHPAGAGRVGQESRTDPMGWPVRCPLISSPCRSRASCPWRFERDNRLRISGATRQLDYYDGGLVGCRRRRPSPDQFRRTLKEGERSGSLSATDLRVVNWRARQ